MQKKPNRDRVQPDAENQGDNQACNERSSDVHGDASAIFVPTNDNQPIASIAKERTHKSRLFGNRWLAATSEQSF
jgi:hypothetical protein